MQCCVESLDSPHANQPAIPRCRRIGFSLTNVNTPGAVTVTCPQNEPSCPAFANGYLGDNRITELSASERNTLFPSGTQAYYKLVTGSVPAAELYTIKLWGINDWTPGGTASDPSAEVATVGECISVQGMRAGHACLRSP